MPFSNYHSAEIVGGGEYPTIRQKQTTANGKPVIQILGVDDGTSVLLSWRFPKGSWTVAQARTFSEEQQAKRFVAAYSSRGRKKSVSGLAGDPANLPDDAVVVLSLASMAAPDAKTPLADRDGLPVRRYTKDLLRAGRFIKPGHYTLDVDEDDLHTLAGNFAKMRDKGIRVPINRDHSSKAADAMGELKDLWVEDATLYGLHELVGQPAIDIVGQPAVEVSPELDMDYTTSDGESLGKTLTASSLCQRCVVYGQGDFQIAASRSGEACNRSAPVLILSMAGDDMTPDTGATTMEHIPNLLKELKIDSQDDANEETMAGLLRAHIESKTKLMSRQTEELDTLQARTAAAEEKSAPVTLSRTEQYSAKRALSSDLDGLVLAGKITPAVKDSLLPIFNAPVWLSVAEDATEPGYAAVIAAIGKNSPAELLKQRTAAQGNFELARDDDTPPTFDKGIQNEMIKMAGGTPKE